MVFIFQNSFENVHKTPHPKQQGVALTAFHMIPTFLGTYLLIRFKFIEFKKLDVLKVLPATVFFCSTISLSNLVLAYNPLGIVIVREKLLT